MRVIEGNLVAQGLRFAIVAARFNEFIVSKLVSGAVDGLIRHGASEGDITLVRVPGAFEIPLAAGRMAARSDVDCGRPGACPRKKSHLQSQYSYTWETKSL